LRWVYARECSYVSGGATVRPSAGPMAAPHGSSLLKVEDDGDVYGVGGEIPGLVWSGQNRYKRG